MIQRSHFIICMFALMSVGSCAMAQTPPSEDFQQWTTIAAAWQIEPKLTITTFGELHLGNNVSQFDEGLVSAGITFFPLRWVSIGPGYLYLRANPDLSRINSENRIYGEAIVKAPPFHKFLLSDRARPEFRWLQAHDAATFTQRYRNRIILEYPMKGYLLFAMWEKFYNSNVKSWSRTRYYGGVRMPLDGHSSIQFYLMRQNDEFSRPFVTNVVGVSVMFNFRIAGERHPLE